MDNVCEEMKSLRLNSERDLDHENNADIQVVTLKGKVSRMKRELEAKECDLEALEATNAKLG